MPYQGAKFKTAGHLITVKVYDATVKLDHKMLEYIRRTVTELDPKDAVDHPDMYAELISAALETELFDEFIVPYFEVEVMRQDGSFVGTIKVDKTACTI